jgi:hypothetical protein
MLNITSAVLVYAAEAHRLSVGVALDQGRDRVTVAGTMTTKWPAQRDLHDGRVYRPPWCFDRAGHRRGQHQRQLEGLRCPTRRIVAGPVVRLLPVDHAIGPTNVPPARPPSLGEVDGGAARLGEHHGEQVSRPAGAPSRRLASCTASYNERRGGPAVRTQRPQAPPPAQ